MSGQVKTKKVEDILSTESSTILGLKPGALGSRRGALRASGFTPITFDLLAPRGLEMSVIHERWDDDVPTTFACSPDSTALKLDWFLAGVEWERMIA